MSGCCCRSRTAASVTHVIASLKTISEDGGFEIRNLMRGNDTLPTPKLRSRDRPRPLPPRARPHSLRRRDRIRLAPNGIRERQSLGGPIDQAARSAQRVAARGRQAAPCPSLADYQPERIADELPDMMGFDVEGSGDSARFVITQEGTRLTATYGNEHIDARASGPTAISTTRSVRSAMPACRPVPRLRRAHGGRPIRSRWCRTPTARTCPMNACCCRSAAPTAVEQIVGSYKAISIEGDFKVNNLMGIRAAGDAGDRREGGHRPRHRSQRRHADARPTTSSSWASLARRRPTTSLPSRRFPA